MPLRLALFAAVGAYLQFVCASPTPQITFPLAGDITLCTGYNFTGDCTVMDYEHDTCTSFPQGYHNDVSSLAPLQGWSCTLYFSSSCNPARGSYNVTSSGDYAFLTYGDNSFNSLICNI